MAIEQHMANQREEQHRSLGGIVRNTLIGAAIGATVGYFAGNAFQRTAKVREDNYLQHGTEIAQALKDEATGKNIPLTTGYAALGGAAAGIGYGIMTRKRR